MTYIEQYYNWLLKNPKRAPHKILVVYEKLVNDIKEPKTITFFNKITEENETHTYVFNQELGRRPIEFIEKFCKHSKGKWAGQPVILQLFQKAFIEALFGFVDKETGNRKYKKGALFIRQKKWEINIRQWISLLYVDKRRRGRSRGLFYCYQKRTGKNSLGGEQEND